ncbi:response regulator [Methylopila turkensis]|uniref:Response regulator n=1 Tax=Methylopila turkensis TaxID=1437816 RepID=A0A9W6JM53_9HYPH|nr:response regulator [Methylopila turkensis]GLK80161.1 response regulator [Methylopila turkensis]
MRVLIVEDDMIIAGHLGPLVARAGHELVGLAADRGSAIALLQSTTVDFAFVDIHLIDGWTGVDVVRAAVASGAVAAFTTANSGLVPNDFAGAVGLVEKPYDEARILAVLAFVQARLEGGQEVAPPEGFALSPYWKGRPKGAFGSSPSTLLPRANLHV